MLRRVGDDGDDVDGVATGVDAVGVVDVGVRYVDGVGGDVIDDAVDIGVVVGGGGYVVAVDDDSDSVGVVYAMCIGVAMLRWLYWYLL